jgi:hypothetical protein
MYCIYFQARVPRSCCFLVIGILKSFDHLAFGRTFDTEKETVEFFVPYENKEDFIFLMKFLEKEALLFELSEMPNRLLN